MLLEQTDKILPSWWFVDMDYIMMREYIRQIIHIVVEVLYRYELHVNSLRPVWTNTHK